MLSSVTRSRIVLSLASGVRRVAGGSALLVVLLWPMATRADLAQWAYQTFPFAQALNVNAVYEVTHSTPERLLETIRRWGVDVRLVRSESPVRPVNPLLAGLPLATPELLRQAGYLESYEGLVLHGNANFCATGRSLILIRDTAQSYTLIHEFVQSLLRPVCATEPDDLLVTRFGTAFRRLVIYQRRLYDDPYRLLNPQWRRDILTAQADVTKDLFDRIRIGQSQEAIVEKVLSLYIDERSPFFDAGRRAQGLQYGEIMINNAIDICDALDGSAVFVEESVRNLRQLMRDGHIRPGDGVALTDDDEAIVVGSVSAVQAHLAVVRAELEVLKRFYSR
jgi:hypothetical protein